MASEKNTLKKISHFEFCELSRQEWARNRIPHDERFDKLCFRVQIRSLAIETGRSCIRTVSSKCVIEGQIKIDQG